MARWSDVQQRMRGMFPLDRDDADELALTVPLAAPGGGAKREQRVLLRRFVAWEREMLELRSAFGEIATAENAGHDPVQILRDALDLPIGGIALHGRFLVVVHREQLEPVTLDGVVFLLGRVAALADALEVPAGQDRF